MARVLGGAERRIFGPMALVCAVLIFVGFAPSFYLKNVLHAPPPLSALTILHGVVFTSWVLLFLVQALVIGSGRPALHRQLGVLGAVLFGAVVTVGLSTAIAAGRLGHAPPGSPPPLNFMALPIFGMMSAALLVVLALANRTRPDIHMRLMLAGFIAMTPPALHRIALAAGYIQGSSWTALGAADLLLAAAMLYDFATQKRIHPAYLWSAAVFLAIHVGVAWGFTSPTWLAFATWLTGAG